MARKSIIQLHRPGLAETVSGNSREYYEFASFRELLAYLNVTAASGTTPTLDVYITEKDAASNLWIAQAAALFKWPQQNSVTANPLRLPPGYAAAAPAITDTKSFAFSGFGESLRAEWVLGGTTPSFSFGVTAIGITEDP